jgi:hypothetical protein
MTYLRFDDFAIVATLSPPKKLREKLAAASLIARLARV